MPTPTHMNHQEQSDALKKLLAEQRPAPRWYARTAFLVRTTWRALGWLTPSAAIVAAALLLATCTATCKGAVPSDRLIDALVKVESNGDPRAVGDNGKALGCLQIWSVVVQDVNQVSRVRYTHADALDPVKARAICRAYLARYATAKRLGRAPTDEDFARIWNGGPDGWRKSATIKYWHKVAAVLN